MRIATYNVNGIRAAQRRGFSDWLTRRDPDVVALQEVRAGVEAIPEGLFGDRHVAYEPGTLPGRNGVAVLTREAPAAVRTWSGSAWVSDGAGLTEIEAPGGVLARGLREFAHEGRYLEVDLPGLTVASLYLPKGGLPAELQKPGRMREVPDGGAKYERKMRFLDAFARQLSRSRRAALAAGRQYLLMGDLNIAADRWDVRRWRESRQAEGFLPVEREWLAAQTSPRTLVDVQRRLAGEVDGPYSWWSWMGTAFEKDVGWRIDYHLATPALARAAVGHGTDREPDAAARVADHAAVWVDYAL